MRRIIATTGQSSSCHMCCILMHSCRARCVINGVSYSRRKSMARASPQCLARWWTRDRRCFSSRTRINTYLAVMHLNRGHLSPNSLATILRCSIRSVQPCAASAPLATMTTISISTWISRQCLMGWWVIAPRKDVYRIILSLQCFFLQGMGGQFDYWGKTDWIDF